MSSSNLTHQNTFSNSRVRLSRRAAIAEKEGRPYEPKAAEPRGDRPRRDRNDRGPRRPRRD